MSTPADQDPENTPAAPDPSFAPTEIMHTDAPAEPERRFTAPSSFADGSTQIISTPPEPATEIFDVGGAEPPTDPGHAVPPQAAPQAIPPRPEPHRPRSWGWVVALVLVIAALVAVVILVVVLLTRGDSNAAGLTQLGASAWSAISVRI